MFVITKANAQITLAYSGGSNSPSFSTYPEVMAGSTAVNYFTFQLSKIPNGTTFQPGWTFKIRANGNFTNGVSSISSENVSLKFRSVDAGPTGVSGGAVQLRATDANLISTTEAIVVPNDHRVFQKFDMIIQGGSYLVGIPTGTYSTTLTLSFYDANGALVAINNNIPISFSTSFSNTCSGAAMSGYSSVQYVFDTYSKLMAGGTANEAVSIQYNPNAANCVGWSLKVRANGNFVNGGSSVPPQYVSLRFNRVSAGSPSAAEIGVSNNSVPLGMSDVTLINQSNAPFKSYTYTEHKFDMIIQGGSHLLLATASGTYTCSLTFSLYNQNGQLVSTTNANASFQITYSNVSNYTVTLQNPNVSLQYSTPASYTNGVSVTKTGGLTVTGYTPYQVIVKTFGPNLTSGTNTIPVSVVKLQNTPPSGKPGIVSNGISLSSSDQVIITNAMNDYTYQTVTYDLRYYIDGGNSTINAAPGGVYSSQVIYVILPQ